VASRRRRPPGRADEIERVVAAVALAFLVTLVVAVVFNGSLLVIAVTAIAVLAGFWLISQVL
jgi:Flp pilus assembly protein TadB